MGRIYDVLRALGIRRTYKGYYYVADAVRLVMTDSSRLLYIFKIPVSGGCTDTRDIYELCGTEYTNSCNKLLAE